MKKARLTVFIDGVNKPIVISVENFDQAIRYMRKICKIDYDSVIEIQTESDVLFFERRRLLGCLVSKLPSE